MNNQPRIPNKTTIERHVTKMKELCQRMDKHIADLEKLDAQLEEEFYNSLYGVYRKKKEEGLTAQK